MITAFQLKERLQRRPFRPLRLYLSDGSTHEVPHPEFAWLFGQRLFVGETGGPSDIARESVKELAIPHITQVEEW